MQSKAVFFAASVVPKAVYIVTIGLANANLRERRENMIPICLADHGEPQIIKKIGGTPEVRQHLENLGFNVGGEATVVNALGENIIVKVKESRVAISDELARKIMV